MRETLSIGPVPANEDCQQVGTASYDYQAARAECQRFIRAIRQTVGEEPEGARLTITSNPHDFGSYFEVVVKFDDENELAADYAYKVESDAPANWPESVAA